MIAGTRSTPRKSAVSSDGRRATCSKTGWHRPRAGMSTTATGASRCSGAVTTARDWGSDDRIHHEIHEINERHEKEILVFVCFVCFVGSSCRVFRGPFDMLKGIILAG